MRNIYVSGIFLFLALLSLHGQEMGLKESKEFSKLGDYVRQAQFSPYRNYFAFTIGNNTLRVYDRDWELVYEHQGNPKAVGGVFAFSPDEKYLVYGRYKGFNDMAILRLEDMKVSGVLSSHTDYINHLEFSNDGKHLVSCSSDKRAIVWELKDESFHVSQVIEGFESRLNESSFSPDDRFLATGDSRGHVRILEREGDRYKEFQAFQNRKHGIASISFIPGRYDFVTGSLYGLRRYRLQKDAFVLIDSVEERANVDHPVSFSPDGFYLALGNYQTAVIFKVGQDTIYPVDYVYRHMDNLFGATFSDDGQFFVSYGSDERVIIWETEQLQPSAKSTVVSWLGSDLTLAQRRALVPETVSRILTSPDPYMQYYKDEFETSEAYRIRMEALSDLSLAVLQKEMEKYYQVKVKSGFVEIPLQGLLGYNADLQIYKIKFMETEAGVAIPLEAAQKFKSEWERAYIRATRQKVSDGSSYNYGSYELFNPVEKKYYPVTPLENPFHKEEEPAAARSPIQSASNESDQRNANGGTTYALMFATNVYDSYSDLVNPVLDARTIAMELEESYGVKSEVIVNPSLSETAAIIREYASSNYLPEDNLMVFFAGHGIYDEVFREGYVISRDSKMDDLGKTSYLSHSNLRTMINNIDCPHIFLVMDVCFGGTFDPQLAATHRGAAVQYADISTDEFVKRKLKYKTRLYLTSGGKEYVPDGRPGFHSPFARRFIESLRHYGGEDGVLTTSEILQFVEKVNPQPRFGEFGNNEPGSDFILVVK
jgi:hypothetical protein